jgi:hypothetical protein
MRYRNIVRSTLPPVNFRSSQRVKNTVRWDPDRQDPAFFYQSVALHCAHCQLQILIHRPFVRAAVEGTRVALLTYRQIPMVRKSAPTVRFARGAAVGMDAHGCDQYSTGLSLPCDMHERCARMCQYGRYSETAQGKRSCVLQLGSLCWFSCIVCAVLMCEPVFRSNRCLARGSSCC